MAKERRGLSALGDFFSGSGKQYAWSWLTYEEKVAYAAWKGLPRSGDQYIGQGPGLMPKNWKLLEYGSAGTVADIDVGYPAVGYLSAARAHMIGGGFTSAIQTWLGQGAY